MKGVPHKDIANIAAVWADDASSLFCEMGVGTYPVNTPPPADTDKQPHPRAWICFSIPYGDGSGESLREFKRIFSTLA